MQSDFRHSFTISWLRNIHVKENSTGITLPADGLAMHRDRVQTWDHFDGLVQERRNSIANALELRLSCTNPSIWDEGLCKKDATPLLTHWSYVSLALTHRFVFIHTSSTELTDSASELEPVSTSYSSSKGGSESSSSWSASENAAASMNQRSSSELRTAAVSLLCNRNNHWEDYRKVSNIRRTQVGNKIVDHSDVVGASPVGAAPTTSSFST